MSCILHIESSTQVCSVALSENGTSIYKEFDGTALNHAKVLAPMVRDAISFADNHAIPLDAVAVSMLWPRSSANCHPYVRVTMRSCSVIPRDRRKRSIVPYDRCSTHGSLCKYL